MCVCVCVSFSLSLSLHLPIHPSYSIFGVCAGRAREVTEGAAAGGVPIEGLGTIGKGQAARTAEEAGAAAVGSANVVEGLHRFSSGTIPKRKEMDLERQLQVFSQDRVTRQFGFFERKLWRKKRGNFARLTKLEAMSDAALVASLEEAAADAALAGASVTSASDCRACVVTELINHTLHFLAKSLMQ